MSTMWPTLGSLDVPKARTRKKDADVKTEARKRFLASFGQSDLPAIEPVDVDRKNVKNADCQ